MLRKTCFDLFGTRSVPFGQDSDTSGGRQDLQEAFQEDSLGEVVDQVDNE